MGEDGIIVVSTSPILLINLFDVWNLSSKCIGIRYVGLKCFIIYSHPKLNPYPSLGSTGKNAISICVFTLFIFPNPRHNYLVSYNPPSS